MHILLRRCWTPIGFTIAEQPQLFPLFYGQGERFAKNKNEDGGGGKCDAKKGERHSAGEPVATGLVSPPSSAAASIVVLLLPVTILSNWFLGS